MRPPRTTIPPGLSIPFLLLSVFLALAPVAAGQEATLATQSQLSPEVRSRLADAARDSKLAPWQQEFMLGVAHGQAPGGTTEPSEATPGFVTPPAGITSIDGDWAALSFAPPAARNGPSAIYDPVRNRMVVLGGGVNGAALNDVWALSLAGIESWRNLAPGGSPPSARYGHSAIYDPVRDRMVVFGGQNGDGSVLFNDVWSLSLAGSPAWSELVPAGSPPSARAVHTAIYDPVRDRMVVFGGVDGHARNDVWALSLAGSPAWSQLAPAGGPPPARGGQTAIYDPVRDRMVVFGGLDFESGFGTYNDVWALSLAGSPAWNALTPSGPPARALHSAIYDPVRDQMVVYGGAGANFHNDVWALYLAGSPSWVDITPTAGNTPLGRYGHSAIYDPALERMVVFAGYDNNGYRGDTWVLSLAGTPGWTALAPTWSPPSRRDGPTAIYDPVRDRMLVFGGVTPGVYPFVTQDVWALSLAGIPAWSLLAPTVSLPFGLAYHSAIYDPVRDRMVAFAGYYWSDNNLYRNNGVYALSLAGIPAWSELWPAGSLPLARAHHEAIYDPVRDRMVVFGGIANNGVLNDVWALSLAGSPAWSALAPAGSPPSARYLHTVIYDPVRDRMVVFGGSDNNGILNDVWALSLAGSPTWSALAPAGSPPSARYWHTAIYDPGRDRMVVFGGIGDGGYGNDVWALSLEASPAWSGLAPAGGPPPARYAHTAIHDPVRDGMVVFAGTGSGYYNDTWVLLNPPDTTPPSVTLTSPNGGETFDNAIPITIEWTASDNFVVAHVDLYVSTNGGSTYSPLSLNEPNDGSYDWNGAAPTTQGRVRLVAFDGFGNSAADASDGNFTITDPAPPTIPAPFAGVFTGGPVQLHWGANTEADFASYHLHRGSTADFVPAPGNLVVSQPDTGFVDTGSTWSYYKLSALDAAGHESPFALVTPAGQATGATPTGSGVPVSLASNVQLTFQNVTGGGQSQLTLQTGGTPPPNGLKLSPSSPPLYYVLNTTATFTGSVTVCVTYDPANVSGPEANLKLMHYDTALMPPAWVQVTTTRDVTANVICGTVTHFSEFALMEDDPSVAVKEEIPSAFQLYPCMPNPVSGAAQIRYDLSTASAVSLGLFDLQGRLVRELERRPNTSAGRYVVPWDGRGDLGEPIRAGIYFLKLDAGGFHAVQRVVVTK